MRDGPSPGIRASSWTPDTRKTTRGGGGDPFPRATLSDLVRRTLGASVHLAADRRERAWVESILTRGELELWSRQSEYDQSHSMRVARRVERRLAGTAWDGDASWPAAALMHDVGKIAAGLSIGERIAANLVRRWVGLVRARAWAEGLPGLRRRIGAYLTHGEIGAAMIRGAGGREAAAVWAEVHQAHPGGAAPEIPAGVVAALLASDTG